MSNNRQKSVGLGRKRVPVPAFQTADAMEQLCSHFINAMEEGRYDPLVLVPMFILVVTDKMNCQIQKEIGPCCLAETATSVFDYKQLF